jgi:hypothetical protein
MGATFQSRNMAGTVFRDVNLHQAIFEDVNLSGVRIDHANITGLTILGVRVDHLIRARLAKRDPDAALLCMFDAHDPRCIRALVRQLDQDRTQFVAALRAADRQALLRRPAKGAWSALEHVRHLVLAEELYTNRWILRNHKPFSTLGLLPQFLRGRAGFAGVGKEKPKDLEVVLQAWDRVHRQTLAFVGRITSKQLQRSTADVDFGQGTVGGVLAGLAGHERHHIRKALFALKAAG